MASPILLPAYNPGPMTGEGNNTYLLAGPDGGATLIDAGVGDARHLADLEGHLRAHDSRLVQVLVTHAHPDHIAGAPALARAYPEAVFRKRPHPDLDAQYGLAWEPLADGERLNAGGEGLTAVLTPGHSPDHVAFRAESDGAIFTGDLVVANGTVMIHASRGGDLGDYLASLERVRSLRPPRLLPAHGPEIGAPDALIGEYVRHRMAREAQVLAALKEGRQTVESIAESIYDGLAPALMPAAHETVRAHLRKLENERRASQLNGRWRV